MAILSHWPHDLIGPLILETSVIERDALEISWQALKVKS